MAPPPAGAEAPLRVTLTPVDGADTGSARLRLSPSDLAALGAALGDALRVRVWLPDAPQAEWRFLCVASVHSDQPAAARDAVPAALDACVQLPPLDDACTLAALRAATAAGAELQCAAARLPGRPVPCDALTLRGGAPGCEPLLRQRVLLPGCVLHLGAARLRVAAATAATQQPDGQPLRVLASTRIMLAPEGAEGAAATSTASDASVAAPSAEAVFAGGSPALAALRELIAWPVQHGALAAALGVRWPRGLLLHGPPGCGKTLLVRAVAAECGAAVHALGAGDVFGAYAGESERRLRDAFAAAHAAAAAGTPVVLFLDELDALCPRRGAGHEHEARVTAQLLVLMDGGVPDAHAARLLVVGATNRPDAIDPALRRPGRFEREVEVPVPDAVARGAILELHAQRLPRAPGLCLRAVGAACFGYTGADLAALAREAAMVALEEADAALSAGASATDACALRPLTAADFAAARKRVGASIVRGVAVEPAPVTWDDIGGLEDVKRRLRQAVEWPLQHGAAFARLGLRAPRGVLLHGPPGCSKTCLARAAAHASGATLIPLSGAQLFSMYLGEGEKALQRAFSRARAAAPAIILLDEADGVGARRPAGDGASGGSGAEERLLCTLLSELDGIAPASGVLLIAATNRPGALDAALLRPGRLDLHLFVPPPDRAGRAAALRIHTRRMALAADVDLEALAEATEGASGAELAGVCAEAALAALREDTAAAVVRHRHFAAAVAACPPALSAAQLAEYAAFGTRTTRV